MLVVDYKRSGEAGTYLQLPHYTLLHFICGMWFRILAVGWGIFCRLKDTMLIHCTIEEIAIIEEEQACFSGVRFETRVAADCNVYSFCFHF